MSLNPCLSVHSRFLDFVERNPECLSRESFSSLGRLGDFSPYPLQPWPVLVSAGEAAELARTALGITQLVRQIPRRFFGNDAGRLARFYGMTLREATGMVMILNGVDCFSDALVRTDLLLSADGFQCLEINASNLGGWMNSAWGREYLDEPLIQRFFQEEGLGAIHQDTVRIVFRNAVQSARRRLREMEGEVNLAIVMPDDRVLMESWQRLARERYAAALEEEGVTGELWFCQYSDLSEQGLRLHYRGRRVHAILEQCWGFAPLPVIFSWIDRGVVLFNGPTSRFLSDKRNLALLSEACDSEFLSPEEKAFVESHVPWTRVLGRKKVGHEGQTVDLETLVAGRREDFVIKPAGGAEGTGVHVGRFTPEREWRDALQRGLGGQGWLAQRYVAGVQPLYQSGERGSQPHDLIWGVFVAGEHYGGCFMRLAPPGHGGVINSARGAKEAVLLEVSSLETSSTP